MADNKRAINAGAKILASLGKQQVTMFELTRIVVKHPTAQVLAQEKSLAILAVDQYERA